MVFEKALSYVLNKYLGDFVENLDSQQLNVGIFGGNVELRNLQMKSSALNALDLPVQCIKGQIGRLHLKIPVRNIWTLPTIVTIEDLFLLVAPIQEIVYDEAKEENALYEAKKQQLQKIEDIRTAEAKAEAEKDKPKTDPTFVEKVVTTAIKNLQVKIQGIHIRYEDGITNPGFPFSFGISLWKLDMESTDADWQKAIASDVSKIYKILELQSLAVYWNCNSTLYKNQASAEIYPLMSEHISNDSDSVTGYNYLLGPLSCSARLRMNQRPENDTPKFSIPKIHLNLDMQRLYVGISKAQYRDLIALADSMGRMAKGAPYRKYRPKLYTYRGHYKEWWHFAITCVLSDVARKRKEWQWSHIKAYRNMLKEYHETFKKKLKNKKNLAAADEDRLTSMEKKLDVTSLVIIREKVQMELTRAAKAQESQGWLGWMWGSSAGTTGENVKAGEAILKQFQAEMTPEEKARLYKAIDYKESTGPVVFPIDFIDNSCTFLLRDLEVELIDEDSDVKTILLTELTTVKLKVETRTAGSALNVYVRIDNFRTLGLKQGDFVPEMIISETDQSEHGLLNVSFETNPLDAKCDQRIRVVGQPLRIVYDAQTIIKIIDVFKVPENSDLDKLQAAAGAGLTNFKEMTSTGLQYAIEQHMILDVDLDFKAPYVIIPYSGKFTGSENVLVLNLGRLKLYSFGRHMSAADVKKLFHEGIEQQDIFAQMTEQSYDKFKVELTDLQILMAQSDEDWRQAIRESVSSEMHMLNPLSLSITYAKCLITDDPRLPHNKITGELPSIDIHISEARLMLLVILGVSIPLPGSDVPEPKPLSKKSSSSRLLLRYKELQQNARLTKAALPLPPDSDRRELLQFTILEVKFVMSELSLTINKQESISSVLSELASFKIKSLECGLTQQTFNTKVSLLLGSVTLHQIRDGEIINIINTPVANRGDEYLFKVQFVQVDTKSPELHSIYKSCETSLILDFRVLGIILHQEGLLSLLQFSTAIQEQITELMKDDRIASAGSPVRQLSVISEYPSEEPAVAKKPKRKKIPVIVETIKFRLKADLQEVTVMFATDINKISLCAIRGINCDIIVKETYTQISATLQEISVKDLNPETVHTLIISGTEGVALIAQVVLNNLETESDKPDMDVNVRMGGMKIVFLNWFVSNMLNFLNQFQAAQQAIIDASQAAAQTAKENVKDAYTKATKISLNIHLKAPVIVIPVDSQSYDALSLDLGVINLSNTFLTLDIKNEENFSAVVDDLRVSLSELQIARIRMNNKYEVVKECVLLEPINLDIGVKRNLSTSWYTAIPDVDISGKIKIIKLLLSQADYNMIMSILSGNLVEGQSDEPKPPRPKITDVASDVTTVSMVSNITATIPAIKDLVKPSKVHVFLKFTFAMEQLIIDLYTGGAKVLTTNSPCHNPDSHLGRSSLEGLSIKGRILTDQSIVTSILLVNCLLDDMRKDRGGKLNRLIERSQAEPEPTSSTSSNESLAPPKSMIDVTFQQKGNDIFADVRIYSFTIILSVEYLQKLAAFFNNPDAPEQQSKQTQTQAKPSTTATKTNASKVTMVSTHSAAPLQETRMTINLKLEKPDIILVEHMDSIDTNAMILNSEILVKLRIAGQHQVVNGVIKELQLYTCNYNPAHRAGTKAHVLHPVTLSIAGSTPQDKGLHVEFLATDIRLSVSPATIELLNRVMVTLTSSGGSEEESEEEVFNYSDLWKQKPFVDSDYWFLKIDNASEAIETPLIGQRQNRLPLQELCIISMPSIVVTLEAGVGNKTLPMLLLETSFKGTARNWSSQLNVEASLTVEMGYYNSRLAMWEPLIEPVETGKGTDKFELWELKAELSMNEQEDITSPISETGLTQTQPVMNIDIISEKNLEITISKTCLEVMQNLGKAFALAVETKTIKLASSTDAPFKVLNEIGEDITLLLHKSSFMVAEGGSLEDINRSAAVPLQLRSDKQPGSMLHLSEELTGRSHKKDLFLYVKINSKNWEVALPVMRADKRFFMLNYRGDGHDNWGIISDVKVDEGVTIITLRSIIQVYNHFSIAIDVYFMTPRGNELELVGTVQPGSSINLPLKAVYTPTSELFFTLPGYSISCAPYVWKDLQANLNGSILLQCPKKESELIKGPFILKAVGEIEQVYYENTSRRTMASTCYNIHLRPAVIMKNCLPIDIICCVDELADEFTVKAGDTLQLPNVEPGFNVLVIRLPDYLEKEWSCRQQIIDQPPEFEVWTFHSYDSPAKMSLDLGMHTENKHGSLIMSLYCPFWMLNKTELMLGYRNSDENNVLYHPPNFKGPILFSFNAKNFFGKKKASIRVASGDWSDKFSLDVAGSSGVVSCKADDLQYQIGVHIQLTYNTLTKQVTFTPYYVIINNAPFPIECQEYDRPADPWIVVQPKACSALWPRSELEDKLLKLRVEGSSEVTAPFLYTESHNTLLRLNNKYGGINVDIQLTEGAIYVNLVPYDVGSAPALLVNHTRFSIKYWEKDTIQERALQPKHAVLFAWENPSGPRILCWDKGDKEEEQSDLRRDAYGEYELVDCGEVFWASFLDGMQRVLLFTEDKMIAKNAQASNLLEVVQQEINVSIHGLGLSLVNNLHRQEIMYAGIASSGIIWESCKMNGKRFKQLSAKESTQIETAYQNYLVQQEHEEEDVTSQATVMEGKLVVDFKEGLMLKPIKRRIRRSFQTGLWLQMKTSPSQMQLHAKINRLQIDDQMFDCIFPVVLAPVPLPKSVAADSGIKPFVEVSIVQLLMKNSQIRQFKYFKVLVQEFHVKVDLGFVNAILDLLQQSESSDEEEKKLFLTDMKLVDEPLYAHASLQSIQEQKSFYDLLHFSPLKIHISFSIASGSTVGQSASAPGFLNILLQGLGVTLTDLQDVVFKLAFFERTFTFLTQKQLINEATSHYVGQSVKQLYVLVLGLDVIGNPYGLVLGITKGVEDLFYEPFQGAIQGPGEFAEGLALGVKSLFGHTVGGAAGAMSRITGAMGKGIAALTFDEEFQRKRRETLNKKPATAQEGFARSGKGLVMGVYSGVTGVFTKPVEGAREQGVEGFFKGLGKGAVGLVTRPVAGVVDFASGSLDVVKRATESAEDTLRLRSPRFLQGDGLVRPYNSLEADGHKMLNELSKGKYSSTDVYVAHYNVIDKKEVLVLSDKRLAYICHNDIFGGWQVEWSYTWNELPQPPKVVPRGVLITTSEKKKKMFGSGDTTKTILIGDPSKREEICLKIESLREA